MKNAAAYVGHYEAAADALPAWEAAACIVIFFSGAATKEIEPILLSVPGLVWSLGARG